MTCLSKKGAGLAALLIALGTATGAAAQQSQMPMGQMQGVQLPMGQMSGAQMPMAQGMTTGAPDHRAARQSRRAQRFIEFYDTDGDGKATLDEIVADQGRLFGAIDSDGDKSLSVAEVKRRGRLLRMRRTTTLFDLLDADGDGKLTQAEVSAPTRRWFKRYDANGNGEMEATELPQHRGRGRGGRRMRR